jgi:molybdenum cofactor cytidylyltransferase
MNIGGVVLAAGLSRRAGTFKMALEVDGRTVIEKSIEGMYDLCSNIYVVGGYKVEIINEILKGYKKVQVVYNENYEQGMFTSVREGFRHVKEDRFFYTPGDYPAVPKEIYRGMLEVSGDIVIPVYGGKKGHPVLMNGCFAQELVESDKFSNLKEFINSKGFTPFEVKNPGILFDIDTIDDYRKLLNNKI